MKITRCYRLGFLRRIVLVLAIMVTALAALILALLITLGEETGLTLSALDAGEKSTVGDAPDGVWLLPGL